MWTLYKLRDTRAGFTIIEILITTFIIGTVVTGMFGLFLLSLRSSQTAERRVVAIALANERMEMIRNLPYLDVGTTGGIPSGSIPQSVTITRNTVVYTVATDIRYIDDPYDGDVDGDLAGKVVICHQPPGNPGGAQTLVVGGAALQTHLNHGDAQGPCAGDPDPSGADTISTDYKQVRVAVTWPSQYTLSPVLLITNVAPQGIEGGDATGTLDFTALNAAGEAVVGATMRLTNSETNPPIDLTTLTNDQGRVVLPGLPPGAQTYHLSVMSDGYTTEQTLDATTEFIPSPDYTHLAMVAREITAKTFIIDQAASLQITTQDTDTPQPKKLAAVAYRLQGTKQIGVTDTGDPVAKVDQSVATAANGRYQHTNLDWDSYTLTIDGAITGYDIKETSVVMPFVINPADDIDIDVTLVPHTPISLQVTVVDPTQVPIDNATVHLTYTNVDETKGTGEPGQVFFTDLPINADYTMTIDAPGFTPLNQLVTVANTTRVTVQLTPL